VVAVELCTDRWVPHTDGNIRAKRLYQARSDQQLALEDWRTAFCLNGY